MQWFYLVVGVPTPGLMYVQNEHTWQADRFGLSSPAGELPIIILNGEPLWQPEPGLARTWLYQL